MLREVNLIGYLPQFVQKYREIQHIMKAENPEYTLVWNSADRVLYNTFIATADEYGISRYEKNLGLFPAENDTLEQRRKNVQIRWMNTLPYTMRSLYAKLVTLCGEKMFTVTLGSYKLEVIVYTGTEDLMKDVEGILYAIVPVNIVVSVIYESPHKGTIYYGGVLHNVDIFTLRERKVR